MTFPSWAEIKASFELRKNLQELVVSKGSQIQSLDGWRALARIWVGLNHCQAAVGLAVPLATSQILNHGLGRFGCHGNFGVDILFVLSGFLIGGILIRDSLRDRSIRFKRFYFRRAMRIFPAYFFVIACMAFAMSHHLVAKKFHNGSFIPNLFLVNNFVPFYSQFMNWTWSLAIEEQFYIWCPIFIFLCGRHLKHFFVSFAILFVSFKLIHLLILLNSDLPIFWSEYPGSGNGYADYFVRIYGNSFVRFSQILIGVLFAYFFERKMDQAVFSGRYRPWVLVASATAVIFYILAHMQYDSLQLNKSYFFEFVYRDIFALCIAVLILASIQMNFLKKILSSRIFTPLSNLSYSAYLLHMLIVNLVVFNFAKPIGDFILRNGQDGVPFHNLLFGIGMVILAYLATLPLYLLIEKPFINMRDHF